MSAPPARRALAIDLGERRIGLAVGDESGGSRGLPTMMRRASVDEDGMRLRTVVGEHRITELLVGLPLHADGTLSPQARRTFEWATEIARTLDLPLLFVDERYSSERAAAALGRAPRGRSGGAPGPTRREARRAAVDREAARLILDDARNPALVIDGEVLAAELGRVAR